MEAPTQFALPKQNWQQRRERHCIKSTRMKMSATISATANSDPITSCVSELNEHILYFTRGILLLHEADKRMLRHLLMLAFSKWVLFTFQARAARHIEVTACLGKLRMVLSHDGMTPLRLRL
eukprot:4042828-Amphidinium_carterae.1